MKIAANVRSWAPIPSYLTNERTMEGTSLLTGNEQCCRSDKSQIRTTYFRAIIPMMLRIYIDFY